MSSKIHPAENPNSTAKKKPAGCPSVLTVWKRSSMSFQGTDGFTVFDSRGRLVFRVDNYTRKSCSVLLMDGSGKALLTLRPQVQLLMRMQHQWSAYRGEGDSITADSRPAFAMRRPSSSLIHRRSNRRPCEAEIFLGGEDNKPDLKCEGSFRRRNCNILVADGGRSVANISRKRINNTTTLLLNDDVFTLTVHPGFDPALVMAFVIVLDRISSNTFAPLICSY